MKIGYFGDGVWAHGALSRILSDEKLSVSFVCARYEAPDPILEKMAAQAKLPFITHKDINSTEFITKMLVEKCDIFVSMSFNQIFKSSILQIPPKGVINCHAGKLPFYRGRNILNWALINDEKEFGVTVHYVDAGIDTGDIILQEVFPISDMDNYKTLLEKAQTVCPEILYKAISRVSSSKFEVIKQKDIHPRGFYCSKRQIGDELIDWDQNSRDIFNFIRAICAPGPMALTYIGHEEMNLNKCELIPEAITYKGIPGAVLEVGPDYFVVKTRDSSVKITEWVCRKRVYIGARLCKKPL